MFKTFIRKKSSLKSKEPLDVHWKHELGSHKTHWKAFRIFSFS